MRGIFTALITPFNSSNEIDLPAFRKILRDQKNAGVAGVVPCGTTGESPCLSLDEKKQLIEVSLDELKSSGVKVIAGTGTNNTAETVEFSRWADQKKVDGVLIVTPYYNKPSQTGLEGHFQAVADAVSCEVILYNVPGRTGVSLSADTVTRLSQHPKIRSLKEASGNVAFTSEILNSVTRANSCLDVLSGDDVTFLSLLSIGAVGSISVASNLFPVQMVALQKAFDAGNLTEALEIHRRFFPLFKDLFIDSNPVPIKFCMSLAGWCDPRVRMPLTTLSSAHQAILKSSMLSCGLKVTS